MDKEKKETKEKIENKIKKPSRKRPSRKKKDGNSKKELKKEETPQDKLRAKIRALSSFRIPKAVREERMDLLEEVMLETKNKAEKERLKTELSILETVSEKEENFSGEFPVYAD